MTAAAAWLEQLPSIVGDVARRWSLVLGPPLVHAGYSWVAPATRDDGSEVMLKIGFPHMEAEHEIAGLRFWAGDPTVHLLEYDESLHALLLERCEPEHSLRSAAEAEQDHIIAALLKRLWRLPQPPHPFRPLSEMVAHWCRETRAGSGRWPDASLVHEGLELFEELAAPTSADILLATDLHAGNVLSARREAWLVIDPKPFIGDVAYDATQHLFNCRARLSADPYGTIRRFAKLLDIDPERVRLWMFARAAAEPRASWTAESLRLARVLRGRLYL